MYNNCMREGKSMKRLILLLVFLSLALPGTAAGAENTVIEVSRASINANITQDKQA